MAYKVYVYGSRKAFSTDGLALGTRLPFDIFVNEGNVFTKVYSAGQLFGPAERTELLSRGAKRCVRGRPGHAGARHLPPQDVRGGPREPRRSRDGPGVRRAQAAVLPDRPDLPDPGEARRFRDLPAHRPAPGSPWWSWWTTGSGPSPAGSPRCAGRSSSGTRTSRCTRNTWTPSSRTWRAPPLPRRRSRRSRPIAIKEKSKTIVKDLLEDPRSGENIKKGMKVVSDLTDCILSNRNVLLRPHHPEQLRPVHLHPLGERGRPFRRDRGLLRDGKGRGADPRRRGAPPRRREELHPPGDPEQARPPERPGIRDHEDPRPGRDQDDRFERGGPERIPRSSSSSTTSGCPGTGYPNQLSGTEISTFGRICAIADCYDAMTTNRPYKDAGTPFQALMQMKVEKANYDADILDNFIRMLGKTQSSKLKSAG